MKGKDLIRYIQENNLEDFNLEISVLNKLNGFPSYNGYRVTGVADVGYSDNIVILDAEDKK